MAEVVGAAFESERPTLRSRRDALVFATHAVLTGNGFRCVGTGEEGVIQEPSERKCSVPDGWNHSDEAYSLRYRHFKSCMTFVVKALAMDTHLFVHAMGREDGKLYSVELDVDQFIASNVPLTDYSALIKDAERLTSLIRSHIIHGLVPETQEEREHHEEARIPEPVPEALVYPRPLRYPPIRYPSHPRRPPFDIGQHDGPFAGVDDPFTSNLIGPGHPGFFNPMHPHGRPVGGRPRFDPYGPEPFFPSGPDNDELPPPGPPYM